MFRLLPRLPLYSSDDAAGGGPASTDKDDVIKFLGEGDEKPEVIDLHEKPPKDKTIPKDKDGEEEIPDEEEEIDEEEEDVDDELKDIEDELEGPTDDQLELMTPVRRREILKKYPTLFKDFPYLERAYYREQQFTELLPTIDDAKKAVEKSSTLDRFEAELMDGNIETILKAVHSENPRSFAKIADEYLGTLAKVDERAYHHVLGNTIKHTIIAMVQEARTSKNEKLQEAAQLLNQFVFGSSDFKPPSNLTDTVKGDDKKDTEITQREREFNRQQFQTAKGELDTRITNTIKATIEGNIDPKDSMTAYVKKNASREALETLQGLIDKDSRFKSLLDKLWEKAFEDRFSKPAMDRIRSAYTSKAKTLLPSVIKKARIEALRGMGKRVRESPDDKETIKSDDTRPNKGPKDEKPHSTPRGKIKDGKDIPRGMSTLEFLSSD